MIVTKITDGLGTGRTAIVNEHGTLVTGPAAPSVSASTLMGVAGQTYNLVDQAPAGFQTVLTGFIVNANKNVGVNDAIVTVFANTVGPLDTAETTVLLQLSVAKSTTTVVTPIEMHVGPDLWVNGNTDDDDVYITLLYYYSEELSPQDNQ